MPGHGRLSQYLPARGRRAPRTHRPAAARAPRTTPAGVHLRPRVGPANSLSAARVRGRRAMAENRAVLPPDGGQAAADGARPRPPHHALNHAAPAARTLCMKIPSASSSLRDPIFFQSLRAIASAVSL